MTKKNKKGNSLGEVFGFPTANSTDKAQRYRAQKLCPYNNKVPNCTKDKARNPLGVCSIKHNKSCIITCPIRFREEWLIVEHAANFAFSKGTQWTSLSEIKLLDKNGRSAGNIDFVLVAYNEKGIITDFVSLEVQGVYISGNLRNPFEAYLKDDSSELEWKKGYNYPKPDYLSSSRKRLIPQMLYKGGIFKSWGKKQTVALQKSFFETLPVLPTVSKSEADIAWFLYDLVYAKKEKKYTLQLVDVVYTEFEAALQMITVPKYGLVENFLENLQKKLDKQLSNPPDTFSLNDIINE